MFTAGHSAVTRRVVLLQLLLLPATGAVALLLADVGAALAAMFGVATALVSSVLLAWREGCAARHPEWDQHRLMRLFIRLGVERLLALVTMLALGFGWFGLKPLPLLLGLTVAQAGWLALLTARKR